MYLGVAYLFCPRSITLINHSNQRTKAATALILVKNNITMTVNGKKADMLVLLDSPAVIDTIDLFIMKQFFFLSIGECFGCRVVYYNRLAIICADAASVC